MTPKIIYSVTGFVMKPGVIISYIVNAYARLKSFPTKNKKTPINGRKILVSPLLLKTFSWFSGLDKTCIRFDNGFAIAFARRRGKKLQKIFLTQMHI